MKIGDGVKLRGETAPVMTIVDRVYKGEPTESPYRWRVVWLDSDLHLQQSDFPEDALTPTESESTYGTPAILKTYE